MTFLIKSLNHIYAELRDLYRRTVLYRHV